MTNAALATALEPALPASSFKKPWKFVTHYYPDTDAYACLWAAIRFIAKNAQYEIAFVRAGTQLPPEDCEDFQVLHMDTGHGELDQHEKCLKSSSSFKLLAEKYGFVDDPGIRPILQLTIASDNVEEIPRTDVHYVLKGLAYQYRDPGTKEVDWQNALTSAQMMFDIIYSQATLQDKNFRAFQKHGILDDLGNGYKTANLGFSPQWRDAAFQSGADVVVFFARPEGHERDRDGPFYPIVQCHRKYNKGGLVLDRVIAGIREAEAKARNMRVPKDEDVWAIGSNPCFGGWMMHDSRRFISCGTRSHPLVHESEFTKLGPTFIYKLIKSKLSELIPRTV